MGIPVVRRGKKPLPAATKVITPTPDKTMPRRGKKPIAKKT